MNIVDTNNDDNDGSNMKLDIYDLDRADVKNKSISERIANRSNNVFGVLGYGNSMQNKLIRNEIKSNKSKGINPDTLTEENIENIENNIRNNGKQSVMDSGMDDVNAMRVLIHNARVARKLRNGGTINTGKRRRTGQRRKRSTRKRMTPRRRRTTRRRRPTK